ncbi:hypothetical protein EAG11_21715 [Flavobacterium sp. 140616W15]|nr:hypothetical protein EAG11_21715 [Flavobacterium sp. 140616W15]
MKLKQLFFAFVFIELLFSCSSNKKRDNSLITSSNEKVLIRKDFKKYFDNCNVEGAIAIYDNNNHTWILSDTINTRKETLHHLHLKSSI